MNKSVVIVGASGHGKVVADIILKNKDNIVGFLDDNTELAETLQDFQSLEQQISIKNIQMPVL